MSAKRAVRVQPLLAVADVPRSRAWYTRLLGLKKLPEETSDHDHLYNRLYDGDALALQLHRWDAEEHPNLVREPGTRPGHGVLVWFEVDDFEDAAARARAMNAEIVEDVHRNPAPGHWELWLRDPDGYVVVVASPDGSAP